MMRIARRNNDEMTTPRTLPKYELRARRHGPADTELEI